MDEWRDHRDDQTLEDKVAQGKAVSIHDLPALFQEGDDYRLINFIDHVVDVETEEVVTYGTPLIRRTLGYMDEALYHLSRAINCSVHIATIEHSLGHPPIGALYALEYGGAGIDGAGASGAGGGDPVEIPCRLKLVDADRVELYTTQAYAGTPEVHQYNENEFSLVYPDSRQSLYFVMR